VPNPLVVITSARVVGEDAPADASSTAAPATAKPAKKSAKQGLIITMATLFIADLHLDPAGRRSPHCSNAIWPATKFVTPTRCTSSAIWSKRGSATMTMPSCRNALQRPPRCARCWRAGVLHGRQSRLSA
jgi:hypothetical protein